jgi:hypothetical protein
MEVASYAADLAHYLAVFALTSIAGYPLTRGVGGTFRLTLAFPMGFASLSAVGAVANLAGAPVFALQALSFLILASFSAKEASGAGAAGIRQALSGGKAPLLLAAFFSAELVYFYVSGLIMWGEGDGTFHASVIRMISEGMGAKVSLLPASGTSAEYAAFYPKMYHIYAAFFVRLLGIGALDAMKVSAAAFVVSASMSIYALCLRLGSKEAAAVAFAVSTTFFIHVFPLVWSGYPHLAGEMMLCAAVVSLGLGGPVRQSLARNGFLILAMCLTHPLYIMWGLPPIALVLLGPLTGGGWRLTAAACAVSLAVIGGVSAAVFGLNAPSIPEYHPYVSTFLHPYLIPPGIWQYLSVGLIHILLITAYLVAVNARGDRRLDLPIGWVVIQMALYLPLLLKVYPTRGNMLRQVGMLYIPLSVIWGFLAVGILKDVVMAARMAFPKAWVPPDGLRWALIAVLLASSVVFNASTMGYFSEWKLDGRDYGALKSLEGREGVLVNLDYTGRWAYPIAGMEVTNPRVFTQMISDPSHHPTLLPEKLRSIAEDPDSQESTATLEGLAGARKGVYLFVSTLSVRGNFSVFDLDYPRIDVGKFRSSPHYSVVYDDGAVVLKYAGGMGGLNNSTT